MNQPGIIFLLSLIAATRSCPIKCSCSGTVVTCRGPEVRRFPSGIPRNTTVIQISNTSISKVRIDGKDFPDLVMLILADNRIRRFNCANMDPQLRYLSLRNNRLTSFAPADCKLTNLTRLDLGYNNLEHFPIPRSMVHLSELKLDSTNLVYFDWCNAETLTDLDLSSNNLQQVVIDPKCNINIRRLDLSHNRISLFSTRNKTLLNLRSLKLSANQLKEFRCTGIGRVEDLSLNQNQLSVFQCSNMQHLRQLMLDHNQIKFFNCTGYPQLTELSIRHNQLTDFRTDLSCPLHDALDLDYNRLKTFNGTMFSNLKHLSLSGNHLTTFSVGRNGSLKMLKSLILAENNITAFQCHGTNRLEVLRLSENQLSEFVLNKDCLLPNLTHLMLQDNQIKKFAHFSVDANQTTNCLRGMEKLNTLDLSSNQLTGFPSANCIKTNITWLMLLNNTITEFIAQPALNQLELLELGYNPLRNLDLTSGEHLSKLTGLGLGGCGLTELNITGLNQLKKLVVYKNNLTKIQYSPEIILTLFNGTNNQFHCDCYFRDFVHFHTDLHSTITGVCASPPNLLGAALRIYRYDHKEHAACVEQRIQTTSQPIGGGDKKGMKGKLAAYIVAPLALIFITIAIMYLIRQRRKKTSVHFAQRYRELEEDL